MRFGYQQFAVLGPESEWAAAASECAGEQQAFWGYHDQLYARQQGQNQGAFSKDNLKAIAAAMQLDTATFNTCLDSDQYAGLVTQETNAAQSYGVRGTPTFLINGRPVVGALPLEQFEQLIEAARGS